MSPLLVDAARQQPIFPWRKSIEATINYVANQRGVLGEIVNMQVIRNEPQG